MEVLTTIGVIVAFVLMAIGVTTVFELARIGLKAVRTTDDDKTVSQLLAGHWRQS